MNNPDKQRANHAVTKLAWPDLKPQSPPAAGHPPLPDLKSLVRTDD